MSDPSRRRGEDHPDRPSTAGRTLRVAAGVGAGALSLALTVLLTVTPESFGLSASPALFERVQEEGRGSEAFVVAWALLAIAVGAVLQTPVARVRGARIGAGWCLAGGYAAFVLLLAPAVWLMRDAFPAHDASGKSGGLFSAVIALAVATPVYSVLSGAAFRAPAGRDGIPVPTQIRHHLSAVVMLTGGFTGVLAGVLCALLFAFPSAGAPAMLLPGGFIWGMFAGVALGGVLSVRLQPTADDRRAWAATSADYARTAAAVLACCLCAAQLGWFLPTWAVALVGLPAPFALMFLTPRDERLARWTAFRTVELPKGAWD
ncbi:hypothetical protein ABZZ79_25535 [Streptomyces sp. NPDC006458]|uniref:hypothetical protein n=1 Tax=Streptomyces sp. NPDC006458 TaxID=3154302 RepID=UPI0033A00636